MPDGRTAFKTARRGVESGGHWLSTLFHLVLAAAALAVAHKVLSHSPAVHGLGAVAGRWLKTLNLLDLLKGIFK